MQIILLNWFYIILLMTVAWLIYLVIKNPGIIDVFWSISITLSGIHFLTQSQWNSTKIIFASLLILWCCRLSGHLLITRIIPKIKEQRYVSISKKWKLPAPIGFFLHFQFQGILAIIIATPFLWIDKLTHFNIVSYLSTLLSVVGIIGESLADKQLHDFKKNTSGPVCNTGLWQYSRHPNYFFEFLIWLGFGLAGVFATSTGFLSLLSPALLLFIMLKITGPITEAQSLSSRGEAFKQYQKRTAYFLLWPNKKD